MLTLRDGSAVVQSKTVLRLVSGQTCTDVRKKWFGRADIKTLKMPERSSASFESCEKAIAAMPVPEGYKKIQAHGQIKRRPGEVTGEYIVPEHRAFHDTTEALRRVRNSRDEKNWSTSPSTPSHVWKYLGLLGP